MTTRRLVVWLGLLAPMLLIAGAQAWESECRQSIHMRTLSIEESICRPMKQCNSGLATARGVMLGEHTWITVEAMKHAGLRDFVSQRAVPDYWSPNLPVSAGPDTFQTGEPAPPGVWMQEKRSRPLTIPEMSQLPDWSYSLFDWLLGNEHCFLNDVMREPMKRVQACHSFATHMGPVNSTHFPPQTREIYTLYHRIALEIAVGCSDLQDRLDADAKQWDDRLKQQLPIDLHTWLKDEIIASCEREALAFEALGTHYSADTWSSGHMWQRWGSPNLPGILPLIVKPFKEGAQWAAVALGAWSGTIHGWRAVAVDNFKLGNTDAEHDRLCMPGPFHTVDNHAVRWRYPNETELHLGAGDDYLFPCKGLSKKNVAGKQFPIWALTTSPQLKKNKLPNHEHPTRLVPFQRDRMIECLAAGFAEVYNAGPQTLGGGSLQPQGAVKSSDDDKCWTQRVTNHSFWLGTGMSAWPASRSPRYYARVMVQQILGQYGETPNIVDEEVARRLDEHKYSKLLRASLTAQQFRIALMAAREPEGTQLAELEGFVMGSLFTFGRNSEYAHLIPQGDVPYLEEDPAAAWTVEPTEKTCLGDQDCPVETFCGIAAASDGIRRCYTRESPIIYAYRAAHTKQLCEQEGPEALGAARAVCRKSRNADSTACSACVDVVLPKLRNACDEACYDKQVRALADGDKRKIVHGSLCDYAGVEPKAPVYRAYDPDKKSAALEAARKVCFEADPAASDRRYARKHESLELNTPVELGTSRRQWDANGTICGAGHEQARAPSFTFTHAGKGPGKHTIQLTATPADPSGSSTSVADLELTLFKGDCTTLIVASKQTLAPDRHGVPKKRELIWSPASTGEAACVRVKAANYGVLSGYWLDVRGGGKAELSQLDYGIYNVWIDAKNDCSSAGGAELIFRVEPQANVRRNRNVHSGYTSLLLSKEGDHPQRARTVRAFVGIEPTHVSVGGKVFKDNRFYKGGGTCPLSGFTVSAQRSSPQQYNAKMTMSVSCDGSVSCGGGGGGQPPPGWTDFK